MVKSQETFINCNNSQVQKKAQSQRHLRSFGSSIQKIDIIP